MELAAASAATSKSEASRQPCWRRRRVRCCALCCCSVLVVLGTTAGVAYALLAPRPVSGFVLCHIHACLENSSLATAGALAAYADFDFGAASATVDRTCAMRLEEAARGGGTILIDVGARLSNPNAYGVTILDVAIDLAYRPPGGGAPAAVATCTADGPLSVEQGDVYVEVRCSITAAQRQALGEAAVGYLGGDVLEVLYEADVGLEAPLGLGRIAVSNDGSLAVDPSDDATGTGNAFGAPDDAKCTGATDVHLALPALYLCDVSSTEDAVWGVVRCLTSLGGLLDGGRSCDMGGVRVVVQMDLHNPTAFGANVTAAQAELFSPGASLPMALGSLQEGEVVEVPPFGTVPVDVQVAVHVGRILTGGINFLRALATEGAELELAATLSLQLLSMNITVPIVRTAVAVRDASETGPGGTPASGNKQDLLDFVNGNCACVYGCEGGGAAAATTTVAPPPR